MTESRPSFPTNLQNRAEELASLAKAVNCAHYRLVWMVGASRSDRSAVLRTFCQAEGGSLLDVGQVLSKALLEVSPSLRAVSVEDCFANLLDSAEGSPVCLDWLEILFEPSLKLYPFDLVRAASRFRTIVASWPGGREGDALVFGPDGHPAQYRIPFDEMESQLLEIYP